MAATVNAASAEALTEIIQHVAPEGHDSDPSAEINNRAAELLPALEPDEVGKAVERVTKNLSRTRRLLVETDIYRFLRNSCESIAAEKGESDQDFEEAESLREKADRYHYRAMVSDLLSHVVRNDRIREPSDAEMELFSAVELTALKPRHVRSAVRRATVGMPWQRRQRADTVVSLVLAEQCEGTDPKKANRYRNRAVRGAIAGFVAYHGPGNFRIRGSHTPGYTDEVQVTEGTHGDRR